MKCDRQLEPLDRCAARNDGDALDAAGACVTCGRRPRKSVVVEVRRFDCCGACPRPGDCAHGDACALGFNAAERAAMLRERVDA